MRSFVLWWSMFGAVHILSQSLTIAPLSAQMPDRQAIAREIEPRFPMPAEPVAPIPPLKPGAGPSWLLGLLVGGGVFVGVQSPCGKARVIGPAPYGGRIDGAYVAPGASKDIAAPIACTAGFGLGAAMSTVWMNQRARANVHRRALSAFEQASAAHAVAKAAWERAVDVRNRSLDSAVTVTYAAQAAVAASRAAEVAARAQREVERVEGTAGPEVTRGGALREVPLVPPSTRLSNPNAVAVLIGNQAYDDATLPAVEYAARDVAMMRRYLMQTFGFREENIIVERDASLSAFARTFGSRDDPRGQLFSYVRPDSSSDVFIFFSGHAVSESETGAAHLLPSDADITRVRLTGYPLDVLLSNVGALPARSVSVVLEAGLSGVSDRGVLTRGSTPPDLRPVEAVLAGSRTLLIVAARESESNAWYDVQRHGLFTYVFLDVVGRRVADDTPPVQEIMREVSPEVLRLSRRLRQRDQTPLVLGAGQDLPLAFARVP